MMTRVLMVLTSLLLLAAPTLVCADTENKASAVERADVVIYYFHGEMRCQTCLLLEEMTVSAVRDSLTDLLNDGSLGLAIVNLQATGNEHFVDDFKLEHQSVVLAAYENGEVRRWSNLERIWELYDKPQEFGAYIADETNLFFDEARAEAGSDDQ